MRFLTNKWLFLAFGFFLSCGKERTLNVRESWSIDPPLGQIQNSPIQIELQRNFFSNGNSESKLNIQVSGEAAEKYSKLKVSIANQNFSIGESSVNFSSLLNQDLKIEDSDIGLKVPRGFFLNAPAVENEKICYKSITSASSLRWDDIEAGLFNISFDSYLTQSTDYGIWRPEFDVVQALYPGTTPNTDHTKLADKSVTVSLIRSHSSQINTIPVTISVKESFPSVISFNCGN